jgi:23S rRNA (guanosine2251-2'-O)-methyltransferase
MPRITLLLHNIRSTHNVGSIFRTAEGFGVEKIILSGYTPYPELPTDPRLPHIRQKLAAQIHKTALGAEAMVPFEYHDNPLTWLEGTTLPLVALEQHPTSQNLRTYTPPPEFILLLGEEVNGIEDALLTRTDAIIEIPMQGKKESFNVSIAAGIALYALSNFGK